MFRFRLEGMDGSRDRSDQKTFQVGGILEECLVVHELVRRGDGGMLLLRSGGICLQGSLAGTAFI
jgi:hypothetical protein